MVSLTSPKYYFQFKYVKKILFVVTLLGVICSNQYAYTQDWIVTDIEVFENDTITVQNSLIIKDGGSLTLKNVRLEMDCDHWEGIIVEPGGSLFILQNSHILPLDPDRRFQFFVTGSKFEMRHSELDGPLQFRVETDSAVIDNNIIKGPVSIWNDFVKFTNNQMFDRGGNLYMWDANHCLIDNNDIHLSHYSIYLENSHYNRFTNNRVSHGIILVSSNDNTFKKNEISANEFGINMMNSCDRNTLRDNRISGFEGGIVVWGWNNHIENNTITDAVYSPHTGIYMVNTFNSVVTDNVISGVGQSHGLFIRHSSNNLITNNNITAGDLKLHWRPTSGILLYSNCLENIILDNSFSGFHRGVSLFYDCNSNTVSGNEIVNTMYEGMVVDQCLDNRIYSNNQFVNTALPNYDSGGNHWDVTGPVPALVEAVPPVFSDALDIRISGHEVMQNQTLNVANIMIEEDASLSLRHVTMIMGAENQPFLDHDYLPFDIGIQVQQGGSLTIEDSKIYHHPYGAGFQIRINPGASFVLKNSEVRGCGSEWWSGGMQIAGDNAVLENNLIEHSMINLVNCRNSRIFDNEIIKSYQAIIGNTGFDAEIRNNRILHSVRAPIYGSQPGMVVVGNFISNIWEPAFDSSGDEVRIVDNTILNVHGPFAAIPIGGNNVTIKKNYIQNSKWGIIPGGEDNLLTIAENTVYDCGVGYSIGGKKRLFEFNQAVACGIGIHLDADSSIFKQNTIADCDTGLAFSGDSQHDNTIYLNSFEDNTVQAIETPQGSNNWYFGGQGNYWSDYSGTDADGDGIGDTPYQVHPNKQDRFPLMTPPTNLSPIYLVVEPIETQIPSFSPGDTNVVVYKFNLRTLTETSSDTASWFGIRIDKTGSSEDRDISSVEIWRDKDNNGLFHKESDHEIGSGRFVEGSSEILFAAIQKIFATPVTYFITLDISDSISAITNTVGIHCADSSYFWTRYPATVQNDNFPLRSDERTLPVEETKQLPAAFKISQNYPNPFNAGTIIEYKIPLSSNVSIQLFNIKGQIVKTLLRGKKAAGSYFEYWDGTSDRGIHLPSGIYFYRISFVDQQFTKKMILLR